MKAWLLVGLACVLVLGGISCKQKAAAPGAANLVRQAEELDQATLMKLFLDAMANQPCATNISARFQTAFNEAILQKLLTQTPTELKRKLETLERKTNQHPFTEEQLKEAIRRKER